MASSQLTAINAELGVAGTPSSMLTAVNVVVVTDGATSNPDRRLTAVNTEAVTDGANSNPNRMLLGVTIEYLAPTNSVFVGWGLPV